MASSGIIFDLKKYAIHDGPGIRTTVFFKGCPLKCWWCHNPEGREPGLENSCEGRAINNIRGLRSEGFRRAVGCRVSIEMLLGEILKDQIFYDQSGGGVTFSGGEPMLQPDFLLELLETCKGKGLHTVVDTSGYAPEDQFGRILNLVDLFLYDLKVMDNDAHEKYVGVSNRLIISNLMFLLERGAGVALRVAMVPGVTDTEDNLQALADYITPLRGIEQLCLLPYNRLSEDKYERLSMASRIVHRESQTREEMLKIGERFRSLGYPVKIGG